MSLYQRGFKMSFNKQLAGSLGALLLLSCSGAVAESFQGRQGNGTTTYTPIDILQVCFTPQECSENSNANTTDTSLLSSVATSIYSWNGNGSIINTNIKSIGATTSGSYPDGIGQDYAKIYANSLNNPVIFFQWQRYSEKGGKLEIKVDTYDVASDTIPLITPKATIIYGVWNTPTSKKRVYRNVSLPFIIDPAKDGLAKDGQWYTIAVAFDNKPASDLTIVATPTTQSCPTTYGCYETSELFSGDLNVDGKMWTGVGSLMTHGSGTGDSITQDYVNIEAGKSTVSFFQWNRKNSKTLRFKTDGCDYPVNITYGAWDTRDSDRTISAKLNSDSQTLLGSPNDISEKYLPKNWVVLKIESDEKMSSTCQISVGTEKAKGGTW
jgi:hypothetical protein